MEFGADSARSTRLKKTRAMYFLDLFEGLFPQTKKGQCDLLCVERLQMIGLMVAMLISIHVR